ncbi:PilZ domain-containing protein [Candidatus Nitrospira inopinata]|nr:PilZ domain-containing protein [Candidatus Nitrospira inopinata]
MNGTITKAPVTCKGTARAAKEISREFFQPLRYGARADTVLVMERRQHRRVRAGLASWVRVNAHEVSGRAVDLSLGGAKIESALPVDPGKRVTVKLMIPGSAPIVIEQAEIRWVRDRTFGVRFLEIRQGQRDDLERLIDEYLDADESQNGSDRSYRGRDV